MSKSHRRRCPPATIRSYTDNLWWRLWKLWPHTGAGFMPDCFLSTCTPMTWTYFRSYDLWYTATVNTQRLVVSARQFRDVKCHFIQCSIYKNKLLRHLNIGWVTDFSCTEFHAFTLVILTKKYPNHIIIKKTVALGTVNKAKYKFQNRKKQQHT